jgi:hypothetical protein
MRKFGLISILVFLAINVQAQNFIETYPILDWHLHLERIPEFGSQSILNQYKTILHADDTIVSFIHKQVLTYPDRSILIRYNDNGTLFDKIEVKLVNDSTISRIYEYADDYSVFKQLTLKSYNKFGLLTESRTISSEFDIPYSEEIVKYEYIKDTLLTKKQRYEADTLLQKDSLVYNTKNKLAEVHIYNHQYGYDAFKQYNYSYSNGVLDNIKTYGQDSMLYKKIIFPEGNQYRPKGEILIKEYRDPEKSRLYAVETKKHTKSQYSDYTELVIEEFFDHAPKKRELRKYDQMGRILEKQYNLLPGQEGIARKELYTYEIVPIE